MSAAFTIGYSDHQSHGVYEELRKAYNERRTALGQGLRYWDASVCEWDDVVEEDIAVAVGDRIQNHNFFREIQQWIVDNCGYFLDPRVNDYSGWAYIKNMSELANVVGGYPSAFEYLCKEVIGGNLVGTSDDFGFREWDDSTSTLVRSDLSVAGSGHARGKVIAKLVGETPWCVTDDICTCLSALRATKITGTGTGGAIVPKANSGLEKYGEDFDGLFTPGNWSNYTSDSPSINSNYPAAAAWTSVYSNYHKRFNNSCRVDYYVPEGMSEFLHSAKLYFKTKLSSKPSGWGGDAFDAHGTGCEQNAYGDIANLSFAISGSVESQQLLQLSGGSFTLDPATTWPPTLYVDNYSRGFERYGGADDFVGVALWNFTNGIAWA